MTDPKLALITLLVQLGVAAASAPKVEFKWVSVLPGNGPYGVLQPGITASSQSTQMPLTPESSAKAIAAGGVAATRISGVVPPANTLPAGTGSLVIASRTACSRSTSSMICEPPPSADTSSWATSSA